MIQIFFASISIANTLSTFHSQAAHGFDIKTDEVNVENSRGLGDLFCQWGG